MSTAAPHRVVGVLTPPDSLDVSDAVLETTAEGLRATGIDGFTIAAPWHKLRISERLEGVERSIHFPDGRVFQTTDDDGIDLLVPRVSQSWFGALRQQAEHHWRAAFLVAGAAGLALVLIFNALIPVLAGVAADWTPPQVDSAIGRSSIGTLQTMTGPSRTDPALRRSLQSDFSTLARTAGFAPNAVRFQIVDGGRIGANALAVPGGYVLLTDQMIARARSRDEIVGVLAHELGHLHYRHGVEKLYRAAALSAALYLLIGGDGGLGGLASLGAGVVTSAYSRDMEREADAYAVRLLRRTGYDPTAFGRLLVRLERETGSDRPSLMRSHPVSQERLDMIQDLAAD